MRHFIASFLSVIAISLVLPLAAPTLDVQSNAYASQHQAAEPQQDVSDSELEVFAQAFKKISKIRSDYESRLREVQDPQMARELQQQAQTEMITVVEEQGLTVPRYNEILAAIQNNEELRRKFNDIL